MGLEEVLGVWRDAKVGSWVENEERGKENDYELYIH